MLEDIQWMFESTSEMGAALRPALPLVSVPFSESSYGRSICEYSKSSHAKRDSKADDGKQAAWPLRRRFCLSQQATISIDDACCRCTW